MVAKYHVEDLSRFELVVHEDCWLSSEYATGARFSGSPQLKADVFRLKLNRKRSKEKVYHATPRLPALAVSTRSSFCTAQFNQQARSDPTIALCLPPLLCDPSGQARHCRTFDWTHVSSAFPARPLRHTQCGIDVTILRTTTSGCALLPAPNADSITPCRFITNTSW